MANARIVCQRVWIWVLLWKWMADVCALVKVMHCRMCLVIMVLLKWAVWQWYVDVKVYGFG